VNETHIRQYFNTSSDSLVSMYTKGVVWAWSLDARENESALRNYVIRDSDCDGVFDEVYGLDYEFHVPDCLKQGRLTAPVSICTSQFQYVIK